MAGHAFLRTHTRYPWLLTLLSIIFIGAFVAACGGSGGGDGAQQNTPVNQPPQVSITIPTPQTSTGVPLAVSGTVRDDGLPDNNLIVNWQVIDPAGASASIENAGDINTTVTFTEPGTFTLQLSVSDGEFTVSRSIAIQVDAVNQAPVVDAGADQTVTVPDGRIVLSGNFTDDNLSGTPAEFLWQVVEPAGASVIISDASALSTEAIFTNPGNYILSLTVNDGELAASDTVAITVNAAVVGTFPRPVNQTCIAPNLLPLSPTRIAVQPAFPQLPDLGEVNALKQPPGNNANWYAAQAKGSIVEFANTGSASTTSTFLDLQSSIRYDSGGELGLLGMAFHPDYANNGQVFLHYTMEELVRIKKQDVLRLRSVVSRFTQVNGVWNEEVLLKVNQPTAVNNGGGLEFDHNGNLLISLGDGGTDNDSLGLAQDTSALLGSVLRIDVDNGTPYAIPADNPFAGNALCNDPETVNNGSACPEIYAYGLRNPRHISVDSAINVLWASDSGATSRSEINTIESGRNYGWNVMEGSQCNPNGAVNCDQTGLTLPVYDYLFSDATRNVVGGYVFRSGSIDFLYGRYIFGDMSTGQIFATTMQNNQYVTEQLLDTDLVINAFARSQRGEVFVLDPTPGANGIGNNIWKIVPDLNGTQAGEVAANLSQTGCVDPAVPTQASPAMISYDVINPLWTDSADKQRFFAIPDGTTINVSATGNFEFPVGSVMMKHFILNGQYIETRLLMYHPEGWLGYSYEWQYDSNGNPVDAILLDTGKTKTVGNQTWHYPSRQDCLECHTADTGRSIGLEVLQLNREFTFPLLGIYTSNQLLSYQQMGLLSGSSVQDMLGMKLVARDDVLASSQDRAKSYLHSNCAYCHTPTGPFSVDMDLRYITPLAGMHICNQTAISGDMGLVNPVILNPAGSYDFPESVLPLRMEATLDSGFRMPPLGSEIVDVDAVNMIKTWINDLSVCPQ